MKRYWLLFIVVLFSIVKLSAQIDAKDLVLYMPFNGNANDSSSNKYNGVVHGATLTAGAGNQPNTAYYFNGVDNSIIIPNVTALDGQLKAFTILIKLMPMDIIPQPDVQDPYGTAYNFLTWHRNSMDSLQAFLYSKIRTAWSPPSSAGEPHKAFLGFIMDWCSGNVGTASGYAKDSIAVDHQWLTVAYVYDAGTMRVFHNCKAENEGIGIYPSISDLCHIDPMQISLGNVPQSAFQYGYRFFKGKIDELRIYKRALSDEEVKFFADTLCKEVVIPVVAPLIAVNADPCKPNHYTFTDASAVKDFIVEQRAWKVDNRDAFESDSLDYTFIQTGNHTIQLMLQGKDTAFSVSTTVTIDSLMPVKFLTTVSTEVNVCENSSVELKVPGGSIYNWQPCMYLSSCAVYNPIVIPEDSIIYKITATNENNCADSLFMKVNIVADNARAFIPAAFTPNNDGLNDFFGVLSFRRLSGVRFTVYNKFGQAIFTSSDKHDKWDGKYKNSDQPSGTYIWTLQYQSGNGCAVRTKKGTVQLIR